VLAIRAGRAFDGERVIRGGVLVLVDGQRIAAVDSGAAPAQDGCQLVEFPTGAVLPGLIDMHVHLCGDAGMGALDRLADYTDIELDEVIAASLRQQLAAGVTTVRDLGDRRYAVVDWRTARRTAEPITAWPTVVAAGPPITSPSGALLEHGRRGDRR
jgi:imidazolonepropionase-like amidohydrolase